jgi:hypothetical protein
MNIKEFIKKIEANLIQRPAIPGWREFLVFEEPHLQRGSSLVRNFLIT